MKKIIFPALAAALISAVAEAAPVKYVLERPHSQIIFSVMHLGFSNSHGRFDDFSGHFTFDPDAVEQSSVEVTVNPASVNMGDQKWDDHLKNPDFFNVAKFPAVTFKSTKVEKTGDKTGKLTGDLTILGVTRPVTLDVVYNKSGIHPYSKQLVAGFSATGTVKRSEFGMGYGIPNVGDDVKLIIEVEGIAETETPKP